MFNAKENSLALAGVTHTYVVLNSAGEWQLNFYEAI